MGQLNLEIRHGNEHRVARETLPIERPEGFGDDEYAVHAASAADLVRQALIAEAIRTTGVVMMVVEEGALPEEEIQEQFRAAAIRFNYDQTWRTAHVIEPEIPSAVS